jgi:NAD(P)-dependent dehydrogenase (short-subunit alcohol dehydrogenase family)
MTETDNKKQIVDLSSRSLIELLSLEGRCAIVTGGAQGFGAAIAKRLAEAGASVVIADRNIVQAEKTVKEMEINGLQTMSHFVDIFDAITVQDMVRNVLEEWGSIDILVNNAGIFSNCFFDRMPLDEFQSTIDVNVTGTFNCSQAVVREMKKTHKAGSIINIASVDAFKSSAEGLVHYTTAKHAIAGLTRSLAMELGSLGIRVNAVCPGASMTEGAIKLVTGGAPDGIDVEAQWDGIVDQTPLRRLCQPDDVARAVTFLASDMAAFVTGAFLVVDGGILVQPLEGYIPSTAI